MQILKNNFGSYCRQFLCLYLWSRSAATFSILGILAYTNIRAWFKNITSDTKYSPPVNNLKLHTKHSPSVNNLKLQTIKNGQQVYISLLTVVMCI